MSGAADHPNPKPPSVDRLALVWRRINDHKIAQWSVAYVALAYGVQHAVILTSESFEWPRAVARISMLLLALGLPVVVTLAWYQGERASRQFSKAELSILSALLVIGSLLFYAFVQPSTESATGPRPAVQQASVAAARAASASVGNPISIAVLPFTNLSSDPEQEFFSDGMTEEITSALAKVPSLRVVARTSAFQFKGEKKDLRAVGQALGATHLIEGSVRKAGTRLRITAQLIKADDGTHLWTENYDRELTDIFVIQEDIAQAITLALRIPLGLQQGETLVRNRTKELESYDQYLRARTLVRARGTDGPARAVNILQPVVVRDPDFAPAWALLASAYRLGGAPSGRSIEETRAILASLKDKGIIAAREAIRLDPRNAGGYAALAGIQAQRGKWAEAEALYLQAFAADPNDADALFTYGSMLFRAGRLKDALNIMERMRALEPLIPDYNIRVAEVMQANGQSRAGIALLEAIPAGYIRNVALARAYAGDKRFVDAADILLMTAGDQATRKPLEEAASLLRKAPTKGAAPSALPELAGDLGFVYVYVGAPNRVLEFPEYLIELRAMNGPGIGNIWRPELSPVRKTERFKALVRNAGLVEYWLAKGWPDLCHPTTADDFACD